MRLAAALVLAVLGVGFAIGALAALHVRQARHAAAMDARAALDKSYLPHSPPDIVFARPTSRQTSEDRPAASSRSPCFPKSQLSRDEAKALQRHSDVASRHDGGNELIITLSNGRLISFVDTGCESGRYIFVRTLKAGQFAVVARTIERDRFATLLVSTRTGRITPLNGLPYLLGPSEGIGFTYGSDQPWQQPYLTILDVADDRLIPVAWCLTPLRTSGESLEPVLILPNTILLWRIDRQTARLGFTKLIRDETGWKIPYAATKVGVRDLYQAINERCLTAPPDFNRLP